MYYLLLQGTRALEIGKCMIRTLLQQCQAVLISKNTYAIAHRTGLEVVQSRKKLQVPS